MQHVATAPVPITEIHPIESAKNSWLIFDVENTQEAQNLKPGFRVVQHNGSFAIQPMQSYH